jgi:hypothetical protein
MAQAQVVERPSYWPRLKGPFTFSERYSDVPWHQKLGNAMHGSKMQSQPRRAASIAAMSIFFICIIASNARFADAGSGSVIAFVRAIGVICQDNPHLSLHQPHALSWPPLPTIAFQ